jgi:adenylate cyclase class 2
MKKEIEVKAKVKDFKSIKAQLEKLGSVWSAPIVQNDEIFMIKGLGFDNIQLGDAALRIRKAKGKVYFTLKKTQTNHLDKIEKEVEISDAETMREALIHMDYHSVAKVDKTRVKTNYNDMEICLDEVEGLGSFIEAEKITGDDAAKTQAELFAFLETLGVKKEDQVFKGYDILVYEAGKK